MPCNSINISFQTISSGSKGNSSLLICDNNIFLIDVGISLKRIKNHLDSLNINLSDITGLLITHNHKDHINGLNTFIKKTNIPIFIPKEMYSSLQETTTFREDRCIYLDDNNYINSLEIELIHTSHDAPSSVGYIISYNNKSLVYITDTGYINRKYLKKIINKNIYLIESNHDEEMLMKGPYPRFLKERVISDYGHLSNKTTSRYLKEIVGKDTKYIILAHLSETNNTKEKALDELNKKNISKKIEVLIAEQDNPSKIIKI